MMRFLKALQFCDAITVTTSYTKTQLVLKIKERLPYLSTHNKFKK